MPGQVNAIGATTGRTDVCPGGGRPPARPDSADPQPRPAWQAVEREAVRQRLLAAARVLATVTGRRRLLPRSGPDGLDCTG